MVGPFILPRNGTSIFFSALQITSITLTTLSTPVNPNCLIEQFIIQLINLSANGLLCLKGLK